MELFGNYNKVGLKEMDGGETEGAPDDRSRYKIDSTSSVSAEHLHCAERTFVAKVKSASPTILAESFFNVEVTSVL